MTKLVKRVIIAIIIIAVIYIIAINIKGVKKSNTATTTEDPNANQPMGVTVTSEYEIGDN